MSLLCVLNRLQTFSQTHQKVLTSAASTAGCLRSPVVQLLTYVYCVLLSVPLPRRKVLKTSWVSVFCLYLCCVYLSKYICICAKSYIGFRLTCVFFNLQLCVHECVQAKCTFVFSQLASISVCGAQQLPTMKSFSEPGAFYQYTHTFRNPPEQGGLGHICACLQIDEDVFLDVEQKECKKNFNNLFGSEQQDFITLKNIEWLQKQEHCHEVM